MPSRSPGFPVFDADNHMYETRDALTRYLPDKYQGAIDYVDVHGRTKIVVRGHITDYIRRVCALSGVKAWVEDSLVEKDFLDFEEPYRTGR